MAPGTTPAARSACSAAPRWPRSMSGTPRRSCRRCRRCPMVVLRASMPSWLREPPTPIIGSPRLPLLSFLMLLPEQVADLAPLGPRADPRTFLSDDDFPQLVARSRGAAGGDGTPPGHPTEPLCWEPSSAARRPQDRTVRFERVDRGAREHGTPGIAPPAVTQPAPEPVPLLDLNRSRGEAASAEPAPAAAVAAHPSRSAAIVTFGRRCCSSSSSSESSPPPCGHSSPTASSASVCSPEDGKTARRQDGETAMTDVRQQLMSQ